MAYGENSAQAVRFNNSPATNNAQSLITRGLDAEKELYGGEGPSVPQMPDGMQQISGVTEHIMNQWNAVGDFAKTMWANYRIDVTRPDMSNPLAVKAHDLFQQHIASLQYAGDKLKQSNKLLGEDRQAVRQGTGMILQNPNQGVYGDNLTEDQRFVNTEIDPRAMYSNQAYAKSYDTKGATNDANSQVSANQKAATNQLEEAGAPNRAAIVGQQFNKGIHEQPQFNPNTGRVTQPKDPKPIYDQVTNYRTGILNNDTGVIGDMKSLLGALDVRPVNTTNKKGAYVTEKIDGKIVTSFLDLGASNPSQGYQNLFYKINNAAPAKFRVDPNNFVPYLEQQTIKNEGVSQNDPEHTEFTSIFKSFTSKEGNVDLGDGRNIYINDDTKSKFVEKLDKLAIQSKLRMDDGKAILNVEMTDKKGWGTGDILQIDIAGQEEPLLLDPDSPEDMQTFQNIIDMNSSYLVSPETWKKSSNPSINSSKIEPGDAGAKKVTDLDADAQARSLLELYKASKKPK